MDGQRTHAFGRNPMVRTALFVTGCTLLALSPLVGVIPGPGGLVLAAAGLALILRNSRWAKRRYVRLKRRRPGAGDWADWAMRRPSYRRRRALAEAPRPPEP